MAIRHGKLYVGGEYTLDIEEQARILETLCRGQPRIYACIRQYTTDSTPLNMCLRSRNTPPDMQLILNEMNRIFDTVPLYSPPAMSPVLLYRGIRQVGYKQGERDKGFMSTSSEFEVARSFARGSLDMDPPRQIKIMCVYLLPHYKYKVLAVEPVTRIRGEYEVILSPFLGRLVRLPANVTLPLPPANDPLRERIKQKGFVYVPHGQQPLSPPELIAFYNQATPQPMDIDFDAPAC